MTTLNIRAREQAIERQIAELARPSGREVGDRTRRDATRAAAERIDAPLHAERLAAVELLGPFLMEGGGCAISLQKTTGGV